MHGFALAVLIAVCSILIGRIGTEAGLLLSLKFLFVWYIIATVFHALMLVASRAARIAAEKYRQSPSTPIPNQKVWLAYFMAIRGFELGGVYLLMTAAGNLNQLVIDSIFLATGLGVSLIRN